MKHIPGISTWPSGTSAIERLKNEHFDLAGELPTVNDPVRKHEVEKRIAEIDAIVASLQASPLSEQMVSEALSNLDQVWEELFPAEQARIVGLLIDKVIVNENDAEVLMRSDGLHSLVDELDDREERMCADD